MDNNQNNAGNPFHLDESSIGESKPTESDLGYDAKTFGTAGSNQTGTYNANPYNNQTGTYNADPYSNQTGTYDAGAYNYNMNQNAQNTVAEGTASLQAAQDDACAKKAKTSLILGIILNVLNLGMMCSTLLEEAFYTEEYL